MPQTVALAGGIPLGDLQFLASGGYGYPARLEIRIVVVHGNAETRGRIRLVGKANLGSLRF